MADSTPDPASTPSADARGARDAQESPDRAGPAHFDLPNLENEGEGAAGASLSMLGDVSLRVRVELGRTRMYVEDVLRLNENSVVELDKTAGDPVDIYVNDRHIARGEVLVLDENFCVRISEIIHEESGAEPANAATQGGRGP